ncbi:MAG: hypothetical protein KatS3mg105_4722 [Gemmatales bacterium]|nr:MAG: hypothetical protein KatS3mg105_4722 [Gemmatales bacterium]
MARILVVEDNELNQDMLCRRLRRRGFDVERAADGQQGIVLARSWRPDLILMDMGLPVVDGWEATRRLKDDSRQPQLDPGSRPECPCHGRRQGESLASRLRRLRYQADRLSKAA